MMDLFPGAGSQLGADPTPCIAPGEGKTNVPISQKRNTIKPESVAQRKAIKNGTNTLCMGGVQY